MNLIYNIYFVLMCTTLSGTILVGCGYLIAKIMEMSSKTKHILMVFQVIQIFFLIPFSVLFLLLIEKVFRLYRGYLFLSSRTMISVCRTLLFIWGIGVCIRGGCMVRSLFNQKRFSKNLFPCEKKQEEIFLRMCSEFKIKAGSISLYRSYKTTTPFIMGIIHPKVVLPVEEYEEQQLRVIFTHELNHFRQKDLWVKSLNNLIVCIHFFNPFVYLLRRRIMLWSEFTCDCRSVESLGYTRKYFETITALMMDDVPITMYASGLYEGGKELDWRISHMLKYRNGKKISVKKALVMGIGTTLLGMVLAFQTTVYAAGLSVRVFKDTQGAQEEEAYDVSYVEYTMTGHPDTPGQHVQINPFARSMTSYSWTVYANSWLDTNSVHVSEGGSILVSGNLDPTDQTIRVGIEDASGLIRYINATGTFSHTFSITESGDYRVYMENLNSVDVQAAGAYTFN